MLPKGRDDRRDIAIKRLETQLAELTQVLMANNMIRLAPSAGEGPFEVRTNRRKDPPWGRKKKKQAKSYNKEESQSDSKTLVTGK